MIGKLTGVIDSIFEDKIILDVGGVGYLVLCSKTSISKIGNSGATTSVLIETHVREDQITLFGFATLQEKEWFILLNKVNGVGPKMALNILSCLDINSLQIAIASADKAAFKPISGVGPKLADRIITELKNSKINLNSDNISDISSASGVTSSNMATTSKANNNLIDATNALEQLGFNKSEAFSVVNRLIAKNENSEVEFLIKEGLKELSNI